MDDLINVFEPLLREVQVYDEESESFGPSFLSADKRVRPTEGFQFGEQTSFSLMSDQVAKVMT
jgi:hypothetical protein